MDATADAWSKTDSYLADLLVGDDPHLEAALAAQRAAGLPEIEVAPVSGKLLHLIARISGARRVLEIGTLGGYSTIWLARAVGAEGRVVTIEAEAANAAVARGSLDAAGVGDRVDIRIGRGADVLPTLVGAFDLVFIDADKESNTIYLDWAARLGHPGTVVILDNIGREGEIIRDDTTDPKVIGTRDALRMLGEDPRFDATALQTVGVKGWDGFAVAVVVSPSDSDPGADAAAG
ncbi:methyltransferase [Microbacterium foliorum]|jgi:predicted O-methyltransferase YrrM|uniref:Putative O-methyltransferase n=1 Tax=Microbacterium foliorum TaxID=104336 RepID=A0A0F0KCY7_9MICO|nr:class I SAM-dependent methyltransferase [Microbacterium foliorum]AXL11614.1 methyltransferase [Microbacterium foliorum]KJL18274.1 putative O-methyltransferase [Microbacterium foliorum]